MIPHADRKKDGVWMEGMEGYIICRKKTKQRKLKHYYDKEKNT